MENTSLSVKLTGDWEPALPDQDGSSSSRQAQSIGRRESDSDISSIKRRSMPTSLEGTAHEKGRPGQHLLKKNQAAAIGPSKPLVVKRGKDWDSEMRSNTAKVHSPLIEQDSIPQDKLPPLRRTPGRTKGHRRADSQQDGRSTIPSDLLQRLGRQIRPPPLSLSKIQTQFAVSPKEPPNFLLDRMQHFDTNSLPSLGPQSSRSSSPTRASRPKPPSPTTVLPKYESAFEYAMRPYVAQHIDLEATFRAQQLGSPLSDTSSSSFFLPTFPPPRARHGFADSHSGSSHADSHSSPSFSTPSTAHAGIASVYLSTLLTRCTSIQSWIHIIHKNPALIKRVKDKVQGIHYWYTKMRLVAGKAKVAAEAVDGDEAGSQRMGRALYWVGRAGAGTGDWDAAVGEFTKARRLTCRGDDGCDERGKGYVEVRGRGGLKRNERRLLPVLLEETQRRCQIYRDEIRMRDREVRRRMRAVPDSFGMGMGDDDVGGNEDLARLMEEEIDWEEVDRREGIVGWDGWVWGVEFGGRGKVEEGDDGIGRNGGE